MLLLLVVLVLLVLLLLLVLLREARIAASLCAGQMQL